MHSKITVNKLISFYYISTYFDSLKHHVSVHNLVLYFVNKEYRPVVSYK